MALKPKTCRAMFAAAAQDGRLSKANQRKCDRIAKAMERHPRLARAIQERVLTAYEEDNGPVVGAIPWQDILEWLITNGPAILKFILSILAIFGL